MGAPGTAAKPPRVAGADWTNRRKEVKFAATDLKLHRRQRDRTIDHWDEWREPAPPEACLLLAARLNPDRGRIDKVVSEAHACRAISEWSWNLRLGRVRSRLLVCPSVSCLAGAEFQPSTTS